MVYKNREGGETGFSVQTCCVGGGKTVGDPSADPSPKGGHQVHDGSGGGSRLQTHTGESEL